MTGAVPRRPPNSTRSLAFLPGTGISRTPVVLLLIMPMAMVPPFLSASIKSATYRVILKTVLLIISERG